MIVAEIDQEVARRATVLTGRIWNLGGGEGLDGSLELKSQWVVDLGVAREFQLGITGTGRMS